MAGLPGTLHDTGIATLAKTLQQCCTAKPPLPVCRRLRNASLGEENGLHAWFPELLEVAFLHALKLGRHDVRDWLEKGLAAVEGLDEDAPPVFYVVDPGVMILGALATQLLKLGLIEQGRSHLRRAHERARRLTEGLDAAPVRRARKLLAEDQAPIGFFISP